LEWGKIKIPVAHYRRRNGLTKDIIIFLIAPTIFMGTMVRSPHGYKGGMGGTPPYSAERLAHRTRRNTRVRHCTLRGLVGIPTQSVTAINLSLVWEPRPRGDWVQWAMFHACSIAARARLPQNHMPPISLT